MKRISKKPKGPESLGLITVAEVMAKEVKTIPSSMQVKKLIQWLALNQVSGAAVVDEHGKLAGVVSETDIVKAQAHLQDENLVCANFFEYDPFAGQVEHFEECSLKVLEMPVAELMTREVITARSDEPLGTIVQRLLEANIHRLIVTEGNNILGLISSLDILAQVALEKIPLPGPAVTVADLKPASVPAVPEDTAVRELVDLLTDKDLGGVPVIGADGTVRGVISQADVVRSEAETDRRRYTYPDFYSSDPFRNQVLLISDVAREVLDRQVREFMNPNIISVTPETSIAAAARALVTAKIHRLLVLDPDGRLAGILGAQDILKALV